MILSRTGRKPDFATKSGRYVWVDVNNYDDINEKVVTSKFDKKHHMYKTYGITGMEVHRLSDGRDYIKLDGNIFEGPKRRFSFFASEYTSKVGTAINKQVAKFLKDIKKVRKMNISDDVINIVKCIH